MTIAIPPVHDASAAVAILRSHDPAGFEVQSASGPSEAEHDLLRRYVEASEQVDMAAVGALLREDARFSMPPQPGVFQGRDALVAGWTACQGLPEFQGDWRVIPTSANTQPAAATYIRRPGEPTYRALAVDVLRVESGFVADIVTFGPEMFRILGLPAELE